MKKEDGLKTKLEYAFWYFVIFSIVGLIIETLFCYVTMGRIESRKGFLYGPFCPIYGFGGTVLIICLMYFKQNNRTLFVAGFIIGSIVEYILSFVMEAMYGSRFWEYGHMPFNLNGRICVQYSLYWSILAILLMKGIKPWIDKLINKIPLGIKPKIEVRSIYIFGIRLHSYCVGNGDIC